MEDHRIWKASVDVSHVADRYELTCSEMMSVMVGLMFHAMDEQIEDADWDEFKEEITERFGRIVDVMHAAYAKG